MCVRNFCLKKIIKMMLSKLPVLALLTVLQTLSVRGDGGKSGLKTYCLGNEKTCDEFWAPFDNMFAALVGYDLPKGNPFATDTIEDPGITKYPVLLVQV